MPDAYADLSKREDIARGRAIILGIATAFYVLWTITFLTAPVLLVPGFLYDPSLRTAFDLGIRLFGFGLFGACLLLTWAGFGWARYLLGLYLLLGGLLAIIISMPLGAFGGLALAYGVIEVGAAVALAGSVGVARYVEDRRARGVPWLTVGLGIVCLTFLVAGLSLFDEARALLAIRAEHRNFASADEMMRKFAPGLDPNVLVAQAADRLKRNLDAPGFDAQFQEFRQRMGAFVSLEFPPQDDVERAILQPVPGTARAYNATAHYRNGALLISLEEVTSGPVPLFTDVFVQELPAAPPASPPTAVHELPRAEEK